MNFNSGKFRCWDGVWSGVGGVSGGQAVKGRYDGGPRLHRRKCGCKVVNTEACRAGRRLTPSCHPHEEVVTLLCPQGQFNFVHVIITPLDYECNLVSLQCRKGEAQGWAGWSRGVEPP